VSLPQRVVTPPFLFESIALPAPGDQVAADVGRSLKTTEWL